MKNDLRALYEELKGYLAETPALDNEDPFQSIYEASIWNQFNETVNLIVEISGKDEYKRFYIKPITDEVMPCVRVSEYRQRLSGLIARLKAEYFPDESRNPLKKSNFKKENKANHSFWDLLNTKIVNIAKSRFESGHYADSVEAGLKEVNKAVKHIVKTHTAQEIDGAALMERAFSLSNPIIKLSDLSSESEKNIQKGYLQIFSGAMTGIRNPKAHDNLVIDEKRAIHLLFLSSLLMFKIDERV